MAHHRVLDVDEPAGPLGVDEAATAPGLAVVRSVYDWEAANQRKIDAVQQLEPLAAALNEIEARIDALVARTKQLGLD